MSNYENMAGDVYNSINPGGYYSSLEEARNNKPEPEYPDKKFEEMAVAKLGENYYDKITNTTETPTNKDEDVKRNNSNPKKPKAKKGGEKISEHL